MPSSMVAGGGVEGVAVETILIGRIYVKIIFTK